MQISKINPAQNVNFNGRITTTVANHLKNNYKHYVCNVGAFTGAALTGNLNNVESIISTKLLADIIESAGQLFIRRSNAKGYANINNPITNTLCWLLKGESKLFEKFIYKVK